MKDPHLSFGFQNNIRTSYEKHISQKLDFVKGYCLENNIDKCIFTGDVFDSSTEDKWSFKKFRKNKRELERFTTAGISLFSNVGNHDMFHGWEDSEDTIFGEMVHDNILNNITKNPIVDESDGVVIKIQGIDYSNEKTTVDNYLRLFDEEIFNAEHSFKVAVLHSNVTPKEVKNITDFTYKSLAEDYPDIDMFILGHYHLGYDTTVLSGDFGETTFINNWNFTRVVRDYEVQLNEHSPELENVCISFDKISSKFIVTTDTIKIPFVPYEEAFKLKEIDTLRKTKSEIFKFFESFNIDALKEDSKKDDDELIKKIVDTNNYDERAHVTTLEYLNNAKD